MVNRPFDINSNELNPDGENGTKMYDVFQLHEHIEKDCVKTRTCSECEHEYKTQELFHLHLRYHCDFVKIECSQCGQLLRRKDFRFHKCFTDITLSAIDQLRKKEIQQLKEK